MRQGILMAVLAAACTPEKQREPPDEPGQTRPIVDETTEEPACDPVQEVVNVTEMTATPFPNNALGRALTVTLDQDAGAVVTCTLDDSPAFWRELVPPDATWRWTAQDDPGLGFVDPGFDDSSWTSSPSPFAREDEAATELTLATTDRTWFRTTFEVTDPSVIRSLVASIRRDDGVMVWLNGTEVVRDNVPPLIKTAGGEERTLFPFDLDPALLVAGTNTLAAELYQADSSTDSAFTVRLVAEVDELLPESFVLRDESATMTHEFELTGLLADAVYTCEARSTACGGAAISTEVHTDPLPIPIRLAAPLGMETPRWGKYTLFNHSRPCGGDRSNRLFIIDPEGRVRWYRELPIEATSSIDIESIFLEDGTILWGGGQEPEGKPQILDLKGETLYAASYPNVDADEYHHDIELQENGRILGIVQAQVEDGEQSWTGFDLVEHDPATGEVTWRWYSQDAYDRGELPPPPEGNSGPWHPNSLASVVDAEGPAIYVSLFDLSEVVRIDRTTGVISWRMGLDKDFTMTDGGVWFDRLHSLDIFPGPDGENRVFLYDNGGTRDQSRAMSLTLDVLNRQATIDWEWTEPLWFEPNWGDFDQTPGGTMLVTMAHAYCLGASPDHLGAFVEVDESTKEVLSRIDFLDSDDSTYRSQRLDGCALFGNTRYCP